MFKRITLCFIQIMSVLILIDCDLCFATTIVAVRMPDVFTIAADSVGTFKGGNEPTNERKVSKIFQKNGVIYAVSGLTKDPYGGFDPEKTLTDALSHHKNIYQTTDKVEVLIANSFKRLLLRLQMEDPVLFREEIENPNTGTSILLASFENGQPVAIVKYFRGILNNKGDVAINMTSLSCPGDCPEGVYTFFLGHHKAIDKYIGDKSNSFRMPPERAVKFMVQLEIDAKTPGVGPPIDVAIIDKNGFRWISSKESDIVESK